MKIQLKRWLASVNFLVVLTMLGLLFLMVNWTASRRYARWDVSRQQLSVLSDQTQQTLRSLKEPIAVIVFYQPSHRLFELIKDLLKEYVRFNPTISVEYVDPDQDPARAAQLVQQFQIEAANVVVFKTGDRHKHLSDTDLAEYDYASPGGVGDFRIKTFKGEEAFTSAIISVTAAEQPLIWFVSGHGEKALDDGEPAGAALAKQALEQRNMRVESATLLERTEIPSTTKLVVIAGPTRRFAETEVALLQSYLERGGRLLALIDPMTDTGLDGLLERWGLRLGMDVVVDPSMQLPFLSAANLIVTTYTRHPIVEKMKTLITVFPLTRSVQPIHPAPAGMTVSPLALTTDHGWGETNPSNAEFERQAGQDLLGPVSIASAAEREEPQNGSGPARTRVVAVGDSEFLINAQLGNVGNRDFLLGAAHWLLEQEQYIGIGPKPLESIKLSLTAAQARLILWLTLLILPGFCGILGTGVWWFRRR